MFEQERFIGRLQRRVQAESLIAACFLSGSFGRQADDPFSDVDVALIFVNDSQRNQLWSRRREFIQSIMPYVALKCFDAVHVRDHLTGALYANGCKVDFLFEAMDELLPDAHYSQLRVLKDRDGWAVAHQGESAAMHERRRRIDAASLRLIDERFWVMYWDALRLFLRGDTDKPFSIYLEMVRSTLPTLLDQLPPNEPSRAELLDLSYTRDATADVRHMQKLLQAYVAARDALVTSLSLPFTPDRAFETEIKAMAARQNP